jgi:hypothetical protein
MDRMKEMINAECGMRNEKKEGVGCGLSFMPHSAFRIPHFFLLLSILLIPFFTESPLYAQTKTADLLTGSSLRISQTSAVGPDRMASNPASAYNRDDNEYLVVWEGNGLSGAGQAAAREIFGQRVNAATGAEVGADFRISNMADQGQGISASSPQVVYNQTAHEYLVVWKGSGLIKTPDKFFEIYGQRLSRTGAEAGKDFRVSNETDLGKVSTSFVRASTSPAVAWNSSDNQYLVVWSGIGQAEDVVKMEIYGQLLTTSGEEVGKDFRISDTTDQGLNIHASVPRVAYNSKSNQYLVVWSGGFKESSQAEIWGQGLSAKGVVLGKGNGDFRISQTSEAARSASSPDVVYNSGSDEYLVVFQAMDEATNESGSSASEIYAQRLDATKLSETGPQDFRVSNAAGANGEADTPKVAYDALDGEYLVVWRGVRSSSPTEIFGRRLSATGNEIEKDFQITNMAAIGKDRSALNGALASNSTSGEYLVVWQGNALPGEANSRTMEIFGQRVKIPSKRR